VKFTRFPLPAAPPRGIHHPAGPGSGDAAGLSRLHPRFGPLGASTLTQYQTGATGQRICLPKAVLLPSEVWAVEFTNLAGDRVVEVVGTEHAAREALGQYRIDGVVLLRAPTDFQPVST
jgi:hypothetical protein